LPGLPNQPSQLFSKFGAQSPDLSPAFRSIFQWVLGASTSAIRLRSPTCGGTKLRATENCPRLVAERPTAATTGSK
jgi:hypothetical protein